MPRSKQRTELSRHLTLSEICHLASRREAAVLLLYLVLLPSPCCCMLHAACWGALTFRLAESSRQSGGPQTALVWEQLWLRCELLPGPQHEPINSTQMDLGSTSTLSEPEQVSAFSAAGQSLQV